MVDAVIAVFSVVLNRMAWIFSEAAVFFMWKAGKSGVVIFL